VRSLPNNTLDSHQNRYKHSAQYSPSDKLAKKLAKSWQKKSWQKVGKKLAKSWKKVGKKLAKKN